MHVSSGKLDQYSVSGVGGYSFVELLQEVTGALGNFPLCVFG